MQTEILIAKQAKNKKNDAEKMHRLLKFTVASLNKIIQTL